MLPASFYYDTLYDESMENTSSSEIQENQNNTEITSAKIAITEIESTVDAAEVWRGENQPKLLGVKLLLCARQIDQKLLVLEVMHA